jgi:hypothetical protein
VVGLRLDVLTTFDDQFNGDQAGRVSHTMARLNQARVPAVSAAKSVRYLSEQLRHDLFIPKKPERAAPRMETSFLAQSYHTVRKSPHFFSLGLGRLDSFMIEQ